MVHRMIKRGCVLTPVAIVLAFFAGGPWWALSAAIGAVLALGNLWLAGRVIGGAAENSPQMLLPAALGALFAGMIVLTVAAVALQRIESLSFPVTGIVLIALHLIVVVWESAQTFLKLPAKSDRKELVHGA